MTSVARRERNFFAKEIILRLDRIEQALPRTVLEPPGLCQNRDTATTVEAQLHRTITMLQGIVMELSDRLERMEVLLFSADFDHFNKIDQFVKNTAHKQNNAQLFDITEDDSESGELLDASVDTMADTSVCSSIRAASSGDEQSVEGVRGSWEELPQGAWRIMYDKSTGASAGSTIDITTNDETTKCIETAMRRSAERMDALCERLRKEFLQKLDMTSVPT